MYATSSPSGAWLFKSSAASLNGSLFISIKF
jgi:hypothetical protein